MKWFDQYDNENTATFSIQFSIGQQSSVWMLRSHNTMMKFTPEWDAACTFFR